jgi:hypothetical protein
MPKVAKVQRFLSKAVPLTECLSLVTIKRTVYPAKPATAGDSWKKADGAVKGTLLKVLACERSAAGVLEIVKHLAAIMPGEGSGAVFVADAINNLIATQASSAVVVGGEAKSALFIPTLSPLNTVEPSEIVAAKIGEWTTANPGQVPSQEDIAAMYQGVV